MTQEFDDWERYDLALERIREISLDRSVPVIYQEFFEKEAAFIVQMCGLGKSFFSPGAKAPD